MKRLFSIAFYLLSFSAIISAEIIKGSVVNERGEAMPFVTISVLFADSSLLTGAITDDSGQYSLEVSARTYIIQAQQVLLVLQVQQA